MRKVFSIFTIIAMLVTIFTTVINFGTTSANSSFAISVGTVHASKTGESITVPVNFSNVPSAGISVTNMTIIYDPNQLKFNGSSSGSIVPNAANNFAVNKVSDGKLKILFLDYTQCCEYISTDGVFANLVFVIPESASGTAKIEVCDTTVGDINLNYVPAEVTAGQVNIPDNCLPTPTTSTSTPIVTSGIFTVTLGSVDASTYDEVSVPISFTNIPAKGVCAFDMTIEYDPTQLKYLACEPEDIVPNPSVNFHINNPSDGTLKLLFLDYTTVNEYIKSDGLLANLNFKVIGSSSISTPIKVLSSSFADINIDRINAKILSGSVFISGSIPAQNFEIQVGSTEGNIGDIVTVPVNFLNVPDKGITTCNFMLNYDPEQLEFTDYTVGEIVYNPATNFGINPQYYDGGMKLIFLDETLKDEYIRSDGSFINLRFKILGTSSASTTVHVFDITVGDTDINNIIPKVSSGLVSISTYPVPEPELKINVGSKKAIIGEFVAVPVILLDAPDTGISLLDMKVTYDPSQLEYVYYECGSIVPYATGFNVLKESDGELNIVYSDPLPIEDNYILSDGILVKLIFMAIGSPKESIIHLSDAELGDKDLNTVSAKLGTGLVYISDSPSLHTVSGYILPDFKAPTESVDNAGFKVELIGSGLSAVTDNTGYFEITGVPSGEYDIRITRNNYLTRLFENVSITGDIKLSTSSGPILMWAGDFEINGSQDGAINLEDIVEICKGFNSTTGNPLYQEHLDINSDGALNLEDIMIVAKHFSKISSDY